MIFENYSLPPTLNKHIEALFYFKDHMPEYTIERVVPTGHIFILFELDGFQRQTFDNKTLKPNGIFSQVWISGMHRNFISISAHTHSEMFVIQFKPTGAFPYLHFPLQEINEKVVAAKDVLGQEILALRDTILLAENTQTKFKIAENWLIQRFDAQKAPSTDLLDFTEKLQKEPVSRFKEIIEFYPYTQKQLIQHFKKYIGLTPKYYQRILRFNDILQRINKKEKISWVDITYSCGYADQSHFIKEFTLFCGFNPTEFIKQGFTKDRTNFFPLDRQG